MHLIIRAEGLQGPHGQVESHALDRPAGAPPAIPEPVAAAWQAISGRLRPAWHLHLDDDQLSSVEEWALARLLLQREPRAEEDGRLPWQAWSAPPDSPASTAWARLTPYHGLVGSDRITLVPPRALDLTAAESHQLFEGVQPLFASEAVTLVWVGPLHWAVAHESLRDLPCASLDRAVGQSVQRWQGRTPLARARLLRRLQSEAQMVLHDHPVNQARAERAQLPVNSLWLDHAGAADTLGPTATIATLQARRDAITRVALADAAAALSTWAASLQTGAPPPKHQALFDGEAPTLVLCTEQGAQALQASPAAQGRWGWLQRWLAPTTANRTLADWLAETVPSKDTA